MDKLNLERSTKMTVEIGNALIETPKYNFAIIDTPGNIKFTKNAITGTSKSNAALLVVDATSKLFDMNLSDIEQLKEHARIAFALKVNQLIVAINKKDEKSVNFNKNRFDLIIDLMTRQLTNIGFKPDQYKFVPISALTGDNLTEKSQLLSWWNGRTLVEAFDTLDPKTHFSDKPLRFSVDGIYEINKIGTVVTGSVKSGTLREGQEVVFPLSKVKSKVQLIEMFHHKINSAIPKNIVGICIDVPASKIICGDVCGEIERDPPVEIASFTAQMIICNHPGKIHAGYEPYFYCHSAHIPCCFEKLVQRIDRRHGKKVFENPEWIQKDDAAVVIIKPLKPIIVEAFRDCSDLGSFIIRDNCQTIAVGIIRAIEKKQQ